MTQFLNTPVDKSLGATGTWTDIDLSSNIPAGATGAIFQVRNTHGAADIRFGLRKKGSTDNRYNYIRCASHMFCAIGVDANRKCQGAIETLDIDFHLVGYTEVDATFFTNAYDKSQSTLGAWTDLDLSSELPAGSVAAIFQVINTYASTYRSWGLRKKGSTDNRYNTLNRLQTMYFIVGVDSNRKCQFKIQTADIDFYLLGYLSGGGSETNGVDRSLGSTGSYIDITESNAPAGATGAFVELASTSYSYNFAARKKGASGDIYDDPSDTVAGIFVGLDANKKWEGKIAHTDVDFYTLGYFGPGIEEKTKESSIGITAVDQKTKESSIGITVAEYDPYMIDRMDEITGWNAEAAMETPTLNSTTKHEGSGSLNLIKNNSNTYGYLLKTFTVMDLTNTKVKYWLYIKDTTVKNKLEQARVLLMTSASHWALWWFPVSGLSVGWNLITVDTTIEPNHKLGTPDLSSITKIYLYLYTNNASDTYAAGDMLADHIHFSNQGVKESSIGITIRETKTKESSIGLSVQETKTKESSIGITTVDQKTKESSIGITIRETKTKESSIGLSVQETKTKESSVGITVVTRRTKESSIGISVQGANTKESSIGLSVQETKTKESSIGITAVDQRIKESSIGITAVDQRIKESSIGLSVQETHIKESSIGITAVDRKTKESSIGLSIQGTITKESSIGITVVEAVLKKGFYYAKLGGVPLYGVEKDSFRISKEINQTPSFEMEIANCSENREEILNGITEEFKIYWRHHGEDTHVFTGIINADGIEYVSLDSIQISGFASYVKLSWPFHKHLADEDKESVNTALTYNGSYFDKTTPINNATINDVLISFGGTNHAFYIGENQPFWGMETKYSTKGIPSSNLLDSMDAVTGWNTDGAMSNITVNVTEKKEGTGALNLIKALTTSYNAGILKAISSVDLESKDVMVWLFLKDTATKNKLSVIEVNLMDSAQNGAGWHFSASSLSVGWNLLTVDTSTPPDYSDPSVDLTDITEIQLYVNTNQATDTYAEGDVIADYYRYISYTDIIVLEYSKGSGVWDTLDALDESNAFTEDPGTYNLIIPHPPSDWARNTVNGIKKYWIRYRVVSGSYSTEPKLDQAFIVNVDIYRTYYFNTSAREILLNVLEGTEYTMDSTDSCPEDIISIVADYQSPLRLIAAIPNALTWIDTEDGNKKKAYQWWIDDNKKVHIKGRRGTTYPDDITGDLTIFNNQEDYFHLSNQLWGLGPRDGLSQMRAMIRDTSSIGTHGLREIAVSEEQIANYNMLKTSLQKKIAISKDPMQRIRGSVSTQFWGIKGYEVGDTITLHQEKWHVSNKEFQIVKVDMGPKTTTLDLGISQDHLEGLRDNMQRQLDLNNVRMHGSTTLLEAGPATSNYQRVDAATVYAAKLEIEIPSTVKKIHKVLLSWTLGPYRASVGPNTGDIPAHDHDGWVGSGGGLDGFNAGAGGAFTPGVDLDGAFTPQMIGGIHHHNLLDTLYIATGKVPVNSVETSGTVYSTSHRHTQSGTDSADGGQLAVYNLIDGSQCTDGTCVRTQEKAYVASRYHHHQNTGINTGYEESGGYVDSDPVSVVINVTPYVLDKDSANESPEHEHSGVDYEGHDHDGIAEPAHSDHAIPAEPPHTDHAITSQVGGSLSLDYTIHEVAGNTDMELLVNGESVGIYATAPQTEIRIDGWLNSGNNTVLLQPKVGENNKKGGATLKASGLLFIEPIKF